MLEVFNEIQPNGLTNKNAQDTFTIHMYMKCIYYIIIIIIIIIIYIHIFERQSREKAVKKEGKESKVFTLFY